MTTNPALTRRNLLRSLGVASLGMTAPGLLSSCAKENEPAGGAGGGGGPVPSKGAITIVGLNALSGAFAEAGRLTAEGAQVAIAETPEVAGKSVGFSSLDTQGDIDEAVRRAREALSGGETFFTGVALSSVALALSETINASGGVFTTAVGAPEVTGTECRDATFRWSVSTYGAIQETVVPLLQQNPGLKRWYAITPDYVFGETLLQAARDALGDAGAQLIGNSYHSLEETEFSSYLNNARAAEPDILLLLNFGSQSTTCMKQAVSYGLKEEMEICLAWASGLEQYKALGPAVLDGVYSGVQYWHTSDVPANNAFVQLSQEKFGRTPGYSVAAGYACTRLILDGIERAGSTSPQKVVKALEGYAYDGVTGPEEARAADHQVIKDYFLLQGKAADAMADEDDLMSVVSRGKSFLDPSATGCNLVPMGRG